MNDQERRAQVLRAAAARREQVATSPSSPSAPMMNPIGAASPSTPSVAPPRQARVTGTHKGTEVKIVPNGSTPSQVGQRQGGVGNPVGAGGRAGAIPVGGPARSAGRDGFSATVVHNGGRSAAQPRATPGGSVAQVVQQVRTQSETGEQATLMAPVGGAAPQQSTAPVVDVSVVLSYFNRPQLVEPQTRRLLSQSVQPLARVAWLNQSDRMRFSPAVMSILGQAPLVQANLDMGPWMRWGVAAQATTEFVAVLDDDCMPGPRWLELAIARLQSAEEHTVIAAAGMSFSTDRSDDVRLIGPEAPPSSEVEVDVGRGAWVMRSSTARLVTAKARPSELLSTGLHVAAVVQDKGALTLVLPYGQDRTGWGTLEAPRPEGSVSERMAEEARLGRAPEPAGLREAIFQAYREEGWIPWCVLLADAAAQVDTVRLSAQDFGIEAST